MEARRRKLYPILQTARNSDKVQKVSMFKDKLIIDAVSYKVEDIDKLPGYLHPSVTCTRTTESHVVFFGRDSPYSNFHHSTFSVSGKPFECNELFVCYGKAVFFKYYDTAERILCEPDPGKQKQLARNVKNFDKMI